MVFKLVSAVSSRREVSKLFNRVAIMILLYSSTGGTGIGIYNCLFHSTAIRHSFNLFIYIIGVIVLFFSPESLPGVNSDSFLLAVTPVVVYSNADLAKQSIIKDNKGKSGVYRWTNLVSGKTYVGSGTNLSKRLSVYYNLSCLIKQDYMIINKALLKYGYSGFKLEILEYCEPSNVIAREQYYLDLFKPEYNILAKAGSLLGFKHSEYTRRRMSAARLGISRSKFSEDTRRRMSAARLGISLSEDTRRRISEARKVNGAGIPCVQLEVLDLETGIKTTYDSISEAAIALDVKRPSLSRYLLGTQVKPFKGRYI
jgi:group I intron endonuclease